MQNPYTELRNFINRERSLNQPDDEILDEVILRLALASQGIDTFRKVTSPSRGTTFSKGYFIDADGRLYREDKVSEETCIFSLEKGWVF